MTWTTYRRRRDEVLRDVVADLDSVGDAPDGGRDVGLGERVTGAFGDEVTFLGALQLRWHTRLAGRIERELHRRPDDPDAAVVEAWRATAREMPGIRAVLDRHRERPRDERTARALEVATAKEHALLEAMAGRPGCGVELERRARSRVAA